MAGLCLIKLVITEGFMAVTCERSQVGPAGPGRTRIPALPGLWMQNELGDGLEMGFRGCSKAGHRKVFCLAGRSGSGPGQCWSILLNSEHGLDLRDVLPRKWKNIPSTFHGICSMGSLMWTQ